MQYVIWIPFAASQEFVAKSNNWLATRPEKKFAIVTYNPLREQLGLGPCPVLLNLMNGSQIYMRGHGLPGDPHVTTTNGGRKEKLHIEESIDRLIISGLPPTYRGTIKFYSCFSAVKGVPKYIFGSGGVFTPDPDYPEDELKTKLQGGQFTTGPFTPLAQIGAAYFRGLGYDQCKFLGYKGPLTGEYVDSGEGNGKKHKYCEYVQFDVQGKFHFQNLHNRRAGKARKKF